jgi:hypothetical protein
MRVQRFVVLVCVAAAACNWPTTVCGCTRPDVAYRVEGTVSLTSGAPVAGASLTASAVGTSCAAFQPPYSFSPFGTTTSASDGSFAITGMQYGDICVRLVARRPAVADSIVELIDLTPGRRTQSVSMRFP